MDIVSIIIPVYNVEVYLDRCIASVAAQTYTQLQIILVDDGSTDRSPEICDAWANKDARITVIHQQNGGVSAARNAGLVAATGEYVLWVDSDDYIARETVEVLLSAIIHSGAEIAIGDFIQGKEQEYPFETTVSPRTECIGPEDALKRIYTDSHAALRYAAPWGKLGKRSLYQDIAYPYGKIFEDIYTTHKLMARCSRIAVVDATLVYYFQRPDSIMHAEFSMKKLDYLQALVERVAFFREQGWAELSDIAYDELIHALIWEYSRTRDLLHSRPGMNYIKALFRQVYRKGYASQRYPKENRPFLKAFYYEPELIIWYWRIGGKLRKWTMRNG